MNLSLSMWRSPLRRCLIAPFCLGALLLIPSCSGAQPPVTGPPTPAQGWKATTLATGLQNPWGMTWLPDGRALITTKRGKLHLWANDQLSEVPTQGLPEVFSNGQGALMDIALHPDFASNSRVYMTLSTGTQQANRTTLVRGVWSDGRVTDIEEIFRVSPDKSGGQHFGSRLLFLNDGSLLMSVGDGGNPPLQIGGMLAREQAQNLNSHLGAVVRLTDEGRPAPGNPFAGRDDARPELYSYGHRNIQGMAIDRANNRVWVNEHGPLGGDELSRVEMGLNYGWPIQTSGRDYRTGQAIGQEPPVEGMVSPLVIWTPAHAPSGLAFYTGEVFPNWRGSLFSGGLVSQDVRRIALNDAGQVTGQNRLSIGRRVRDVRQGPDGFLYILTDEENGHLMRIEPDN